MKHIPAIIAALCLAGCAQSAYLYYGDTSEKYYRSVKSPDPRSVQEYKRSLEEVFIKSERKGLPVPPGLYCDYALILAAEGDLAGARDFMVKEKTLWPDSTQFIEHLLVRYNLRH